MGGAVTGTLLATVCKFLPMDCIVLRVIIIPLGAMIIIHSLNLLQWKDAIFVACIVYFALMLKVERVAIAISRTFLTGFGALVALLVNRFICPPEKIEEDSLGTSDFHPSST